jgi:hypothetical protein
MSETSSNKVHIPSSDTSSYINDIRLAKLEVISKILDVSDYIDLVDEFNKITQDFIITIDNFISSYRDDNSDFIE